MRKEKRKPKIETASNEFFIEFILQNFVGQLSTSSINISTSTSSHQSCNSRFFLTHWTYFSSASITSMVKFPFTNWIILNQIHFTRNLFTIFNQGFYIFVAIINLFQTQYSKVILLPVLSYQYCIASIISVNGNFVEKGIISFLFVFNCRMKRKR